MPLRHNVWLLRHPEILTEYDPKRGISVATLAEPAFAYMKLYGATNVLEAPGKQSGYEETGTVSSEIPGIGFSAQIVASLSARQK